MSDKPSLKIVRAQNQMSFAGRGSIIVLELRDERSALALAKRSASETGRAVSLSDENGKLIKIAVPTLLH